MIIATIQTLFFTDIWIYAYTRILQIFRLLFPKQPPTDFLILGVSPEPFEIILYLLITFLIVLLIFFTHKQTESYLRGLNRLIQYTFVTFLILVFLFNLGPYPLKVTGDFFPNLPYLLIYLVTITAFSTEILLLKKILVKSRFKTIILHFGIILALGIFTFPPRFSISGVDYSYFFGPIREIASGKTIYTEISSQYGFLSILFLTALSRLVFLPISYLPILIWLLLLMQYYICFYLIYRQSGSLIWAL